MKKNTKVWTLQNAVWKPIRNLPAQNKTPVGNVVGRAWKCPAFFLSAAKCPDSKSSANMVKSYTGARLFNPSRDGRVLCHQQWKKRQHLKK
jgi:hypothetical protein